ncbi:MAG: PRC-barrel domain-containing protein [Candidatus Devosia symbiotica]|nr:PRC-barrel domain-containing protein [Candidatus Devosia symbiotica]
MIRTLLATTALAALMSTAAMAQDAAPAIDTTVPATTTEAPAADAMAPATGTEAIAPAIGTDAMNPPAMWTHFDISEGYTAVDTDNLATQLIGQSVYSSAGDDADEIGNVSDLIFNQNGQIVAAVIGVGSFLGIGEKSVAVDFSTLEFTVAGDNTERWVLPTTADALDGAPDFIWKDDKPSGNMNAADSMTPTDVMAPVDLATAPAAN